ncbi:MAG TPA: class E sortase [Nocardioides sp.]|uniref:class E sortase n=1 Tax=uncultured Nocardioides sp. TaxID=198441 RepID=UPI000EC9FF8A|nr:class E sortase [uncultured Nocardioides sp.]HCB04122.1 class E sortase [Nocardioides sp.]HRD62031.1 class E sortase [Nocardioides sp.]HRI96892.1 class E sortase [Nocardioides sp.]HRK46623.1 class E sortase [Nocardioides sp.]
MKRVRTYVGLGCLLAGLGLLGWFAWQLIGTTYVSHRAQRDVVDALEQQWAAGADAAETDHGTSRAIVRIPQFGDDYEVPVVEGTSDEALASGIGHFEDTADAGGAGNYVLAGHRITHGEPFRDLPDLAPGDQVLVETRDTVYTYELTTGGEDLEVPFTASWVLASHPANPDADGPQPPADDHLLTLTTCAELFHTDERLVVFGKLVSAEPRGA